MEWFLSCRRRILIFAMKQILLFAFIFLTLASCRVYNRIGNFSEPSNEMKRLTLKQNPHARLAEKADVVPELKQSYAFISSFGYKQVANERPEISADFQLRTPGLSGLPDSVLYFILNGEKIKLLVHEPGLKNTSAVRWQNLHFLVPENLWVSVANAQKIQYRLTEGKREIDVILNPAETGKLKQFFAQACALRDAAFPAIPANPPGLKKW